MADILLSLDNRRKLSLWLKGRERIKSLSLDRWYMFLHGEASYIKIDELANVIDCYGYAIVRLMLEPSEQKEANLKL